jgi:hypothetical protein
MAARDKHAGHAAEAHGVPPPVPPRREPDDEYVSRREVRSHMHPQLGSVQLGSASSWSRLKSSEPACSLAR